MNPIEMLESDHRKVESLFAKLDGAKGAKARAGAFRELKDALAQHAILEECIFYPAVRTAKEDAAQVLISEAYAEHEDVKGLLAEMDAADPASEGFTLLAARLKATVEHHVEEEEGKLFPGAQRLLEAERLDALGERMAAARETPKPTRKKR